MTAKQSFLGIDIGASSVKLVELVRADDGLALTRAIAVPLSGADAGDDEIRQIVRRALSANRIHPSATASAVPARAAAVREIRLPNAEEKDVGRMVQFEAERFIPFPADQIALDHHYMGLEGADAARVLVVATRKQSAERLLQLLGGLGIPYPSLDVTTIAAFNALAPNGSAGQAESVAIVDVGANSTDIITTRGAQLTLARSAPVGVEGLVAAHQEDLSVDYEEAMRLLRSDGVTGAPVSPTASGASGSAQTGPGAAGDRPRVAAWLSRLCGEVRHTIESSRRDSANGVSRALLCGGGALIPGVREALEAAIGVPVAIADPWRGIACDGAAKEGSDPLFAVASGLARKAAGKVKIDINLTPQEVTDVRVTQQRARRLLSVGVIVAAVTIAAVVLAFATFRAKKDRLAYLDRELAPYAGVAEQAGVDKDVVDRLRQIDMAMASLKPGGADALDLLRIISAELPKGVWITELSYDPRDKFVVRGIARDSASVSDSVRALLKHKEYFDDVILDYQNLGQIEDQRVYNFQATCVFPKPEEE